MGNRIEEQNRIGRVWSLCWIAVEIGSINLGRSVPFTHSLCDVLTYKNTQCAHAGTHNCNKTNPPEHISQALKTVMSSHLAGHLVRLCFLVGL